MAQSPSYALGVLLIEQPEILAIFGVMPLCLVFDRKKGTVCRAGLDRRVQSKCFVAELLSREQKVAHIVVVSFPLHQIKTFFFFSGRPGLQLLNPCRQVKWDVCSCKLKKKKRQKNPGISVLDILKTSSYRHNEIWSFVVSNKQCRAVYCRGFLPHPAAPLDAFKAVAFSGLRRGKNLVRWNHPRSSCPFNTSTYSLISVPC